MRAVRIRISPGRKTHILPLLRTSDSKVNRCLLSAAAFDESRETRELLRPLFGIGRLDATPMMQKRICRWTMGRIAAGTRLMPGQAAPPFEWVAP